MAILCGRFDDLTLGRFDTAIFDCMGALPELIEVTTADMLSSIVTTS